MPDNYQYSRLALAIKDKSSLSEEKLAELTEITGAPQQRTGVWHLSRQPGCACIWPGTAGAHSRLSQIARRVVCRQCLHVIRSNPRAIRRR